MGKSRKTLADKLSGLREKFGCLASVIARQDKDIIALSREINQLVKE